MISQREISKIAFRQHKLDKIIEKDYVISWILLGLAGSRLKESFAFKGGTALKKVYFPDYRYSEDLDFTLLGDLEEKVLIDGFRALLRELEKSQDLLFELKEERIERHINTLTFYVDFVGPF
jgi:predicted nucleotidyltransferase component of viral defense system